MALEQHAADCRVGDSFPVPRECAHQILFQYAEEDAAVQIDDTSLFVLNKPLWTFWRTWVASDSGPFGIPVFTRKS